MRNCVVRVPRLLNRALIFSTTETSCHGFPEKLACPEGVSRKATLSTTARPKRTRYPGRSTNYIPRPTDSRMKSTLIWADKNAIHIYSKAKEAFGIDDGAVSKILGMFSRKR
jgi:hypothetical protein